MSNLIKVNIKTLNISVDGCRAILLYAWSLVHPDDSRLTKKGNKLIVSEESMEQIDPESTLSGIISEIRDRMSDIKFFRYVRFYINFLKRDECEGIYTNFDKAEFASEQEFSFSYIDPNILDWEVFGKMLNLLGLEFTLTKDSISQGEDVGYEYLYDFLLWINQVPEPPKPQRIHHLLEYYHQEFLEQRNVTRPIYCDDGYVMVREQILLTLNNSWFNQFFDSRFKVTPIKLEGFQRNSVKWILSGIYLGPEAWYHKQLELFTTQPSTERIDEFTARDQLDFTEILRLLDYLGLEDLFIVTVNLIIKLDNKAAITLLEPYQLSYSKNEAFIRLTSFLFEVPEEYYRKISYNILKGTLLPELLPQLQCLTDFSKIETIGFLEVLWLLPFKIELEDVTYYMVSYIRHQVSHKLNQIYFVTFLSNQIRVTMNFSVLIQKETRYLDNIFSDRYINEDKYLKKHCKNRVPYYSMTSRMNETVISLRLKEKVRTTIKKNLNCESKS